MNQTHLAVTVLALGSACFAQSYTVSPKAFQNIEGNSSAYSIGAYPDGRFMTMDGEQKGSAMSIKGTAYRLDNRMHNTSTAMGRKWTKVTIYAAECDLSKLDRTFTKNQIGAPSKVFDSAVSWPSHTGKPTTLPGPWTLMFPFSRTWSYTGKNGICLDYAFTGGTLSNSGAWTSRTWKYYYKDSHNPTTYGYAQSKHHGNHGANGGCNDRGVTHLYGAELQTTAYFYSDSYSTAQYRGRLRFYQTGRYFGNSTAVLTLLGFKLHNQGWDFPGVYCNKVHVDMTLPTVLYTQFSTSSGSLSTLEFTGSQYGVKAPASAGGIELVTQAGWADTRNRKLLLSSAAVLRSPLKPQSVDMAMVYFYNRTSTTGYGPYRTASYNPIVRYTK